MAKLNRLKNDGAVPSSIYMTENVDFRTKSNDNNKSEINLYDVISKVAQEGIVNVLPYTSYVAKITENGTATPDVTVIYNDTGLDVTFARATAGPNVSVLGTFSEAIDSDKAVVSINHKINSVYNDRFPISFINDTNIGFSVHDVSSATAIDSQTVTIELKIYN